MPKSMRISVLWAITFCRASMLFASPAHAQSLPSPAATTTPSTANEAGNSVGAHPRWTESLGVPTLYIEHARTNVAHRHYRLASRNLRKAAAMLSARAERAYGLDRRHLAADVEALRLTAQDVAAGAISTPAQLDGVLDSTHTAVSKHGAASPSDGLSS